MERSGTLYRKDTLARVQSFGRETVIIVRSGEAEEANAALNANAPLRLVLSEATRLALWGAAIGVGAAVILTRFMASLLFGLRAIDSLTLIGAPLLLFIIALGASFIPARRAAQVAPVVSLKCE